MPLLLWKQSTDRKGRGRDSIDELSLLSRIRQRNYQLVKAGVKRVLVSHNMPFVEEGNQALDIELNFLWSRGTTQRNRVILPSLLKEQRPQLLNK
jgi:hypothetical protein